MKYYLVELKKDFFDSTYETFECWISHCDEDGNGSNNYLTITAQKMENAPGTEYDAISMRLAVDMLNYGAEAQKYFGYNTGDLANAHLTDEQKACGTTTAPECMNGSVYGTCTDSVESYTARARDAQAKGLPLYEAIMCFADSAKIYLQNR